MGDSQEYEKIVEQSAMLAGTLGVPGSAFPPLDIIGMAGIWFQMLNQIIKESGHEIDSSFTQKIILSITTSACFYVGGSKLANWLLHLVPGAGTIAAATTNSAFNYIYTDRLGTFLAAQFSKPDIEPENIIAATAGAVAVIFGVPGEGEVAMVNEVIAASADVASEPGVAVHYEMSTNTTNVEHDVKFSGGHQAIDLIADSQGFLPSCGLEALENMIQSANPLVSNNFSDWVLSMGYTIPFPLEQYQELLWKMGIPSEWINLNHNSIISAISENNTAALIGDAHYLDPSIYPPESFHAITLRDPWYSNGQLVGYIGIDSNCPGQSQHWSFEQVEKMSFNSQNGGKFAHQVLLTKNA